MFVFFSNAIQTKSSPNLNFCFIKISHRGTFLWWLWQQCKTVQCSAVYLLLSPAILSFLLVIFHEKQNKTTAHTHNIVQFYNVFPHRLLGSCEKWTNFVDFASFWLPFQIWRKNIIVFVQWTSKILTLPIAH